MSAGHTPGPWVANSWGSCVETQAHDLPLNRVHGYGSDYTLICSLNDGEYHEYRDGMEQLANARLIAAAPDLLKALAEVLQWHGVLTGPDDSIAVDVQKRGRAAITKATGAA